jgi:hypothetical protein
VAGGEQALSDAPFNWRAEQKKEAGVWCTTAS